MIYIANAALRSVTDVDTASMRVVATISVGEVPKRINTPVLH
jgi:YVTN family beta-propeller protein